MRALVLFYFLGLLTLGIAQHSPANKAKVANAKEIVYFGLDFSKTTLVGTKEDFVDLENITTNYFKRWNLMKFKAHKYMKKSGISDNKIAIERSLTNTADIIKILPKTQPISDEEIKQIVSYYKYETPIEIGLLFVVESLDKPDQNVPMYATFFNIQSGEVLFTKRIKRKTKTDLWGDFYIVWVGRIANSVMIFKKDYNDWMKD